MDVTTLLNRVLNPVRRRLKLLVNRAVITAVNDSLKRQNVQLQILGGEQADEVPRVQNYGHTSVPLEGAEAIVLAPGGVRGQLTVVALDDPRHRPRELAPGDSCLYHHEGHRLLLTKGGQAILECKSLLVTGNARFAKDVEIDGNISIKGFSTAKDHNSDGISGKTHRHPGDSGGQTGTPN
ncbi:phage baseplate assembly protein V [uncultured Endozoicomonas sp.]|uniref:phage baseplate assembly protein V n=1 Tax=uncultured Endozoicomonas sp. TaxID=432652 RepID=UPI0026356101|nr:phage baseplate assembly protein V [uncultured Endozoicomonas sp.]